MSREGLARESSLNQQQAWKGKRSFLTQVKDYAVSAGFLPTKQPLSLSLKIYPSLSTPPHLPYPLPGEAVVNIWWHQLCLH